MVLLHDSVFRAAWKTVFAEFLLQTFS